MACETIFFITISNDSTWGLISVALHEVNLHHNKSIRALSLIAGLASGRGQAIPPAWPGCPPCPRYCGSHSASPAASRWRGPSQRGRGWISASACPPPWSWAAPRGWPSGQPGPPEVQEKIIYNLRETIISLPTFLLRDCRQWYVPSLFSMILHPVPRMLPGVRPSTH